MKKSSTLFLSLILFSFSIRSQNYLPAGLTGRWTFDQSSNLTQADVGTDLEQIGMLTAISGPSAGDGAVRVPLGSYFHCHHNIPTNGTGSPARVNNYSLLIDFRINSLSRWYSFFQTTLANNNDGDFFINTTGNIGVAAIGYSTINITPGQWYRMVLSVSLGNHIDCYLDGHIIITGTYQAPDGRFSLDPQGGNNDVLLFADDNGEDSEIDIAQIAFFDQDLTASQIDSMGGFFHPYTIMKPYLQIPSPTSMMVNWHSYDTLLTSVHYGTSENNLYHTENGTCEDVGGKKWHTVKLRGLQPNTTYFYQCHSGTDTSAIYPFHTPPAATDTNGHVRFIILGDTRTDIATTTRIADSIKKKCIELYGNEWYKEINVVRHMGDIVTSGRVITQYENEFFTPYAGLSCSIPFMVSIGNHELDNPFYYQYLKYNELYDHTYPDSSMCSKYYSYQLGNCKFVSMNSNSPYINSIQLGWLTNVMNNAEIDSSIDFVFTSAHHPGRTEMWPDANVFFIQQIFIPALATYPKHVMYSYGHTHDYERGTIKSTNHTDWDARLLLSGGGGGPLDKWDMNTYEADYPEIHRSFDYYSYQIVDVDMHNKSYTANSYTIGNTDRLTNITLFDHWHFRKLQPPPMKPSVLFPQLQYSERDTIKASPISSMDSLMTSEFQIVNIAGSFANPLYDIIRDYENIFQVNALNYIPINKNAGIDLTSLAIQPGWLVNGEMYKCRVRYRDMNMKWSPWSDSVVFSATGIQDYNKSSHSLKIYPNPFSRQLNIWFKLSSVSKVTIMVYNIKGELVETLADKSYPCGENLFIWNLPQDKNVSLKNGTYIIRLKTASFDVKERVVLER